VLSNVNTVKARLYGTVSSTKSQLVEIEPLIGYDPETTEIDIVFDIAPSESELQAINKDLVNERNKRAWSLFLVDLVMMRMGGTPRCLPKMNEYSIAVED